MRSTRTLHGRTQLETKAYRSVERGALLLIGVQFLLAQSVSPTPGSIQDVAVQLSLPDQFTFEQQFQSRTQGGSGTASPFAYGHGAQVRPWLHYDGIPNTTITGSVSYIYYFTVPGTSDYRHPEWRVTVLGNVKQALSGSSLYEQIRVELFPLWSKYSSLGRPFQTLSGSLRRGDHAVSAAFLFGRPLPRCTILRRVWIQLPRKNGDPAGVQSGGRSLEQRIDRHVVLRAGI